MATKKYTGTVGDLSPEQEKALKLFREKLATYCSSEGGDRKLVEYCSNKVKTNLNDGECLRFLRARTFDVDAAVAMFTKYLEWRMTKNIDGVLSLPRSEKSDIIDKVVPHAMHGYDKEGRPLYFEKTGKISVEILVNNLTDQEVLIGHIWAQEHNSKRADEMSKKLGKQIDGFASVMDLKGLNGSHRKGLRFTKAITEIDANYYPERMGAMYLINAPWIFPVLWNIIQHWIDPVTRAKIYMIKGDPKKELQKYIPQEHLPEEYGGACKECKTSPDCIKEYDITDLHKKLGKDEESMELTKINVGARKAFDYTVEAKQGSVVGWYFKTESNDIGFSVELLAAPTAAAAGAAAAGAAAAPTSPKSKADKDKDKNWIFSPFRVDASSVAVQGSHTLATDGKVKFVWDNSYSYFKSKTVRYEVVVSDGQAVEKQPEMTSDAEVGTKRDSVVTPPPDDKQDKSPTPDDKKTEVV